MSCGQAKNLKDINVRGEGLMARSDIYEAYISR